MTRQTAPLIRVFRSPATRHRGRVVCGPLSLRCALGRSGITRAKREGDGATPAGRLRALAAYRRLDRGAPRPRTALPLLAIGPDLGWCDAPASRLYNRPVRLPFSDSHERMWREDGLYDLVVDLSWNRGPRRAGRGSAIFLHAARDGYGPTEGCIALAPADLRRLVARIGHRTVILVTG